MPEQKARPRTQPLEANIGCWWRFDRYVVENGWIRPARDASLTCYQVWEEFAESKRYNREPPPYASLLKLLGDIGVDYSEGNWRASVVKRKRGQGAQFIQRAGIGYYPIQARDGFDDEVTWANESRSHLPPEAETKIADWAGNHGLLGILPHIAENVTLAPRWIKDDPVLEPTWFTHRRQNGRWRTESLTEGGDPPIKASSGKAGKPVTDGFEEYGHPVHTTIQHIDRFGGLGPQVDNQDATSVSGGVRDRGGRDNAGTQRNSTNPTDQS